MFYIPENSASAYQKFLTNAGIGIPGHHVVLGSGFGNAIKAMEKFGWKEELRIPFQKIPGLIAATVPDHAGEYVILKNSGSQKVIQLQAGRLHGYEGHDPQVAIRPTLIARYAGINKFILTNAAGGLDTAMSSGDAMLIADHVNLTGKNPLTGHNPKWPDGKEVGPRFPDLGNLYELKWRTAFRDELQKRAVNTHEGTYLGLLGPTFETFAEVKLYAQWGMKAVGMSTVWESIALRHSGARVAGVSLISNLGAGLTNQSLNHEDIVETCRKSASVILESILSAINQGKIE